MSLPKSMIAVNHRVIYSLESRGLSNRPAVRDERVRTILQLDVWASQSVIQREWEYGIKQAWGKIEFNKKWSQTTDRWIPKSLGFIFSIWEALIQREQIIWARGYTGHQVNKEGSLPLKGHEGPRLIREDLKLITTWHGLTFHLHLMRNLALDRAALGPAWHP